MILSYLQRISSGLSFIIPLLYLGVGGVLLAGRFPRMEASKQVVFGVILVLYGLFRAARAYAGRGGRL
jgi:hypothetical protein